MSEGLTPQRKAQEKGLFPSHKQPSSMLAYTPWARCAVHLAGGFASRRSRRICQPRDSSTGPAFVAAAVLKDELQIYSELPKVTDLD